MIMQWQQEIASVNFSCWPGCDSTVLRVSARNGSRLAPLGDDGFCSNLSHVHTLFGILIENSGTISST